MDTKSVYSSKAEKYARYRWEYAPRAVEAIFIFAGLSGDSIVADIGAGSGILTRQFVGRVHKSSRWSPTGDAPGGGKRLPSPHPACWWTAARAYRLADRSVDLITAARPSTVRGDGAAGISRISVRDGWRSCAIT
jgi:hypothetical protein